jgi:hypothetical protein
MRPAWTVPNLLPELVTSAGDYALQILILAFIL